MSKETLLSLLLLSTEGRLGAWQFYMILGSHQALARLPLLSRGQLFPDVDTKEPLLFWVRRLLRKVKSHLSCLHPHFSHGLQEHSGYVGSWDRSPGLVHTLPSYFQEIREP